MRAVFLGTPVAAVPVLDALTAIAEVPLVVTQPDRPRGRSGTPQPPPVKVAATAHGAAVVQPRSSREVAEALAAGGPFDVAVLVAYGMLIRPDALILPRAGFVNVHFSILPRWRGAAPVQRAVLAGDRRTGVTLMQLDEGLDTGPIVATATTAIASREDASDLTARLSYLGADLLLTWLGRVVAGQVAAVPQESQQASHAAKLQTAERWLDLARPVPEVLRTIRGLSPWPGAWAHHASGGLRILAAGPGTLSLEVGEVTERDGRVEVGVSGGAIELLRVQPEGGRAMDARAWVRGRQGEPGTLR